VSGVWDDFWRGIDIQIEKLRFARSAAEVVRICPASPGMSSGDGFFAGGGGDVLPDEPLRDAGWVMVWEEAPYFWAMRSPAGDFIEYVEGDLYVHTTMPKPPPHG
jgi:hypothetical protein